jgi:hypothetical protein
VAKHREGLARGDVLVRIGAGVFVVGLVSVALVFVPFLFGRDERGVALSLTSFLTCAGLGLALLGLTLGAKDSQRRATEAAQRDG